MNAAAVEVTGYYKCESCSALTKTRHTWHQCPVTGRPELLMVEGLRETGLPLVEPYWPREAELDDRLTAAHEEYERAVLAATPDDDDDVEEWRAFDEIDRAEFRRYSDMVEASHEVRLRYSPGGSR